MQKRGKLNNQLIAARGYARNILTNDLKKTNPGTSFSSYSDIDLYLAYCQAKGVSAIADQGREQVIRAMGRLADQAIKDLERAAVVKPPPNRTPVKPKRRTSQWRRATPIRKSTPKPVDNFYETEAWKTLRYRVLVRYGRVCMCCGRTPENDGVVLHVDHIKPRSKYPELALVFDNLQVLCADCNYGKRAWDKTDWRPKALLPK